jgi:NADH-quinone oxidoreductase subunit J
VESLGIANASFGDVFVFVVLALGIIGGALMTITRRNPVGAVMSLVATFFALAGMYATMSAHFLAVLQVSVYAGAIMVLFIFVVMILNRDEVEPVSFRGIITRAFGVVVAGFAILVAVRIVFATRATAVLAGPTGALADNYGTVAATGNSLFRDFVYPFEAISLLLMVAIVGGVMVSRSQRQEDDSLAVAERHRLVRAAARDDEQRVGALPAVSGHDDHGAAHGASHH